MTISISYSRTNAHSVLPTRAFVLEYQPLVNADWSNFVERKLLPAGTSIVALQLPDLLLAPDDNNQWQLAPEMPGISADAIQQLLDYWGSANALYVRGYNGAHSDETIHIETGEKSGAGCQQQVFTAA